MRTQAREAGGTSAGERDRLVWGYNPFFHLIILSCSSSFVPSIHTETQVAQQPRHTHFLLGQEP